MIFVRLAAAVRCGTLMVSCLALPATLAAPCSSFQQHGLTPGMTHKQVWERMGGKGRQTQIAVPGSGTHDVAEFALGGAVVEVEFDTAIPRRGEARVIRVETRFAESDVDPAELLNALSEAMGPAAGGVVAVARGLSAVPVRWADDDCAVEVLASRHVPEWWEPGQGPTLHVVLRPLASAAAGRAGAESPRQVAAEMLRPRVVTPEPEEVADRAPERRARPEPPAVAEAVRPERSTTIVEPVDDADYRAPVAVHHPPPHYPPAARTRNQGGRVVMSVLVDDQGNVEDVEVSSVAVSRLLQDAAVRAVRGWRFEPAVQDGETVSVWTTVAIAFDP